MQNRLITVLALLMILAVTSHGLIAEEPSTRLSSNVAPIDDEGVEFFEKNIRPVLSERCYSCHSSKAIRPKGKLLLDSRQGMAKGGEGGAIIVSGQPDQSRLIEAIRWTNPAFQMPPDEKLGQEQISLFEQWVGLGAPDPRDAASDRDPEEIRKPITLEEAGKIWWSFRQLEGSKIPSVDSQSADESSIGGLTPPARQELPSGVTRTANPIDAFIAAEYQSKGLKPVGKADRLTLLRRVYLDLIGIPPNPAEQDAFLNDQTPRAYEAVVDRLLASEQHGVRYARHWLDVFRYADVDERMIAAPGIHLWRDWVVNALNDNIAYDQFVRVQLTGYRSTDRTQMSATGYRSKAEPRTDDLFALGFLARGAVVRDRKSEGELSMNAVETVSTAFLGLTVGCAKCHNHVYDPITQRDYYAMKALFDPLITRKITLATADDLIATGRASQEIADRKAPVEARINAFIAIYKEKLYDDRVAMLPPDVQSIIRKTERQRSVQEQKIADDYFPVLRIDTGKIAETMPVAERKKFEELERELRKASEGNGSRKSGALTSFWIVEVDGKKELDKNYLLTSGDPERPELNHPVDPGWPFAPSLPDFRDGRIEAFSDWLTAHDNPLFARVGVNRIWQWHFGEGLHKSPSEFGKLGGVPSNPKLLDWLASEFIRQNFNMKSIHRLIVTSETYQLASNVPDQIAEANMHADQANTGLWHFPLQRMDAEPIWDSVFSAAGTLDLSLGGPSFSIGSREEGRGGRDRSSGGSNRDRRAAYLVRGYSTSREVMANFLQAFDVDDGRAPCPLRTQTVTASQSLFMMNSEQIERASSAFANRLQTESGGDLPAAVQLGYKIALCRLPSSRERERAIAYLENDPAKLKGLAWLLFNLDEFIYLR